MAFEIPLRNLGLYGPSLRRGDQRPHDQVWGFGSIYLFNGYLYARILALLQHGLALFIAIGMHTGHIIGYHSQVLREGIKR